MDFFFSLRTKTHVLVLFLNKLYDFKKKKWVPIFKTSQENTETFRCEKSAWKLVFQTLRSFETLGSKLIEHGLRIVSKR